LKWLFCLSYLVCSISEAFWNGVQNHRQAINAFWFFWISNGLRELWDKATVLRLSKISILITVGRSMSSENFGFQTASENYGIKQLFWTLLHGPEVSNTVWESGANELYCVGKVKNRSPIILCSLDFSLVTYFLSRKRK